MSLSDALKSHRNFLGTAAFCHCRSDRVFDCVYEGVSALDYDFGAKKRRHCIFSGHRYSFFRSRHSQNLQDKLASIDWTRLVRSYANGKSWYRISLPCPITTIPALRAARLSDEPVKSGCHDLGEAGLYSRLRRFLV
jgi:hypothetical protein